MANLKHQHNCTMCKFYSSTGLSEGICIRFPPIPVSICDQIVTEAPEVHDRFICGEYSYKPTKSIKVTDRRTP
jgi:hypothetical protein